eukprot:gene4051-4697_t
MRFKQLFILGFLSELRTIRRFYRIVRSVGATGGVYKGQGHIQRKVMIYAYKEFLVDSIQMITQTFRSRNLFPLYIVTRVQPKVSKGITDLLLPRTSPHLSHVNVTPTEINAKLP